jgi:hypothetical protein
MLEKALEFKATILLCYGKQKKLNLKQQVLKAQVWAIAKTITMSSNLVGFACMLN